jgi:glycosyltransferase involved in cell wall biosynthesis
MVTSAPSSSHASTPEIAVVVATYNRSNVLRFAIESVLAQTFPAWELVVVGDACTDDSEELVRGYDDARISFVSLGRNFGEQSGPNNVGALLARTPLISYLNHDDLYFPDHLERARAALVAHHADLLFTTLATVRPVAEVERPSVLQPTPGSLIGGEPWKVELRGNTKVGRWRLSRYQPASSWLCRREVIEQLGGWRPARTLYAESSQDFLFRAYRAGFRVVGVPDLTVVAVPSPARPGAYAKRLDSDQALIAGEMKTDAERLRSNLRPSAARAGSVPLLERLRQQRSEAIHRVAAAVGVNAKEMRHRLRGRRQGEQIVELRRRRGL